MPSFKGKAPGAGAGEMSRRTEALRPLIALDAKQRDRARHLRRQGLEPGLIAAELSVPVEEVEKALVQMRMPRPETTRGTLNVTLAAHRFVMGERQGDEPLWQTIDRIVDELIKLRAAAEGSAGRTAAPARRRSAQRRRADDMLPGLLPELPAG